jgi:addiction module HigA family antidote
MTGSESALSGKGLTPGTWKSSIIIEEIVMTAKSLPPVHPGEVLLEEFLKPLGISQNRLARDLAVPAQRINDIVRKNRAVTVDTALRLARYFHTTPQFWLNLQMHYDLEMARETQLVDRVNRDVRANEALGGRGV